ncbi:hypothetical protein [Kribbella antiqua]|nr:hypothetical protein [Kribbella antiqua]
MGPGDGTVKPLGRVLLSTAPASPLKAIPAVRRAAMYRSGQR